MNSSEETRFIIEVLNKKKHLIEVDIQKKKEELVVIEKSIKLFYGDLLKTVPHKKTQGRYSHLQVQDAVLKLMKDNPMKRYKASNMLKDFKSLGGFKTDAKETSLHSSIASILKRLAKANTITVIEEDKKPREYYYDPETKSSDV